MARPSPFADVGALVTGASSGIGASLARLLAREGARLALSARRGDRLEAVAAECRALGAPLATVLVEDLAEPDGPARLADAAAKALGTVDLLVLNAGFAVPGLSERAAPERVEAMVRVNVLAPIVLARRLLPAMLERRRGHVLVVSSMAGILPAPFQAAYAGTKAFDLNWSESLREEVKDRGVVVTALCPGVTDTEFFEAAGYRGSNRYVRHRMDPDRVARAGLRGLRRRAPRVVPGFLNRVLVFAGTRLAPRRLVQVVARRLMLRRPPPVR